MGALQLFIALLVVCTCVTWGQVNRLEISISTDDSFNITVSGRQWFRSGPVKVRHKENWLSSADGSLILDGAYGSSGVDALGAYNYMYFEYHGKRELLQSLFKFTTFVKVYYKIDAIIFGHRFDSGAERTATESADDVISSFPSFLVEDSPLARGYVTFEGNSKLIMYTVAT